MTELKTDKRAEEILDIIWQNDYGLRNILVNTFSIDSLFAFVRQWGKNVIDGEDPAAKNDLYRSVIVATEVAGFSGIPDSVPHTFANGVILNGAITHSDDVFTGFEQAIRGARMQGHDSVDPYSTAFLAAIEATSNFPIACSNGNTSSQVVHSANTWIWAFKAAVTQMIKGLVASGQYDKDLRIIVPVYGIEDHYDQYRDIFRTIRDTGIEDRLCYLVFAKADEVKPILAHEMAESGASDASNRVNKIFNSTFSHVVE